jgi:molybdopterin synthase catalytic subunit
MKISIQLDDFDVNNELSLLRASRQDIGAIVSFIGLVRDLNQGDQVKQLTLEHYPKMTEKALYGIVDKARDRWDIMDATVIHRIGTLNPTDQIVLVAIASAHRGDAFHACEFIMDYLKTEAPFWKKEVTPSGERWVEAKESDDTARNRWTMNMTNHHHE